MTPEALGIVQRLGGDCGVSRWGTGLYVWVLVRLLEGFGKFIEPLDGEGPPYEAL